jgi:replicative DNA helicase
MDMENQFYNEEAEQAILGSLILNNALLPRVSDFLEEKHFYYEPNKEIWSRFIDVESGGKLANQITLKDFFANSEAIKEVGGVKYLSLLLARATGIYDLREYGTTLVELWQKRGVKELLTKALDNLGGTNFDATTSNIENEIAGLAIQEPKKKTQHTTDILKDMDAEDAIGRSSKYIPTGFKNLDDIMNGGIYSQQLCILGARPSVGKTTIGQNVILNASQQGKKCLFISLEVDKRNVMLKFLSNLTSIESWKLQKNARLSQGEEGSLKRAREELRKMGIYVNDSSYLKISQIGQIIKNQIAKEPVDLVVVDYVQIIKGDDTRNKNESLIIKENTTMLKSFAKQYDVSILALAQINRKAVEGANQEPTINDFKSSGGIEEDADVAIILHRDRNEEKKDGYFSESGKLIVAKNRHGRTGEVSISFDGNFGRFNEIRGL